MKFGKRKKDSGASKSANTSTASSSPRDNPYPPLVISPSLREQIIHVMSKYLGDDADRVRRSLYMPHNHEFWECLYRETCADAGIRSANVESPKAALSEIIRRVPDNSVIIIAIKRSIAWLTQQNPYRLKNEMLINADPSGYVPELNEYLERAGVEWRFHGSSFAPATTTDAENVFIAPAFQLLAVEGFDGAIEEFSQAMISFREGDHKSCIRYALQAFESAMITICKKLEWPEGKTPRATDLVKVMVGNGLLPLSQETAYKNFYDTLKNGLPEIRNKTAGHGQGVTPVRVPDHVAQYALNLAGTNLIFLMRCYQSYRN